MFGEQLGQFLLASCCGTSSELTLWSARNSPSCGYRVVRVYVTGPPAPLPLLSKLNEKFPITFKDVRIGIVLRRILKMAEAPLLSFMATALIAILSESYCAECFHSPSYPLI